MKRLVMVVAVALVLMTPAAAPAGRAWPRCYVSGNWRYQVCHCGSVRYPMWFCTRQQ